MKKQKYSKAEAFALGAYEVDFESLPEESFGWAEPQWIHYIDKHGTWTVPVNVVTRPTSAKIYKRGPGK